MTGVRIFKIVLLSAFAYLCFTLYRTNAVGSGWASLTAAVMHHQDDPKPLSPVVVENVPWSSYVLLGLPSLRPEEKYDWIILDSTPGGDVMRTPPDGNIVVDCAYLANLATKLSINRTVHQFLAARCSRG